MPFGVVRIVFWLRQWLQKERERQMDGSVCVMLAVGVLVGGFFLVCAIIAAQEDAELQKNNPELWVMKQKIRLERERLAAEKELAEKKAKQERLERNISIGITLGRLFGKW